jgi:hypothetical protein
MSYWSCARYNLHLTNDEFYRLTPRQFDSLLKRHREQIEHEELLAGIIASVVVNFSLGAPKTGTKPADFMPSQWRTNVQKPRNERMTKKKRQRVANSLRAYFEARMARQGNK